MEKKLQKLYLTYYNLLIAKGLWQAHYQIFLIIFLKKLIKLTDTKIKNMKLAAEYKCLYCNKYYQEKFDEKLKKQFPNAYKFSNHDNNNFILVLRKNIYPYEYMDDGKNSMKHHQLIFTII